MAGNLYDDALDALDDQPTTQQAPANPYLQTLDTLDTSRERELRTAQAQAADQTPERAAEVQRLSSVTGLAPEVVGRNFDSLAKRVQVDGKPYARIMAETPALAAWASDPSNAAIAKDDMEQLGLLEWIVTAPSQAFAQSVNQMKTAELRTKQLLTGHLTREEEDLLNSAKLAAKQGGALGAGESWFRGAVTGGSQLLANVLTGGFNAGKVAALGAGVGGILGGIGGAFGGGIGAVPGAAAGAKFGATAGAMLGGGMFGFELEAGLSYDEFLDFKDELGQPLNPDAAKAAAIAAGAINGGLEAFGLGILAESIPGLDKLKGQLTRDAIKTALRNPTVRAALGTAAKEYTGVLTKETAVEVAQRYVTIMAGELAKATSGQAIEVKQPGAILEELIAEGAAAAQGFLFVAAPGPTMALAADARRAQKAQQNEQWFAALAEGVTQSKTIERMPEAAQALLAQATKGGPVETLYAPAEQFRQYWQDQGLDPAKVAAELTGRADALEVALATDQDLQIPTATYAVRLAGTEHHAFFAQELRTAPDEMNVREGKAFQAQIEAAQEAARQAAQLQTDPAAAVRESVVAELVASGVPQETATTYAALYEGAFGALAQRAGLDPVALYREYGLKVQRPDVAAPLERGTAAPATVESSAAPVSVEGSAADLLGPGGYVAPAPGTETAIGDTGELERAGVYAGEERRVTAGTGPDGVERRRTAATIAAQDPDAPLPVMGNVGAAAAAMLRENPNIMQEADALREQARSSRAPAPPRSGGIVDNISETGETATDGEATTEPAAPRGADVSRHDPESLASADVGVLPRGSSPDRLDEGAADRIPPSVRDRWRELLTDARAQGYAGSDDSLAAIFLEKLLAAHTVAEDLEGISEDTNWRGLLKAISDAGGIGLDAEKGGYEGEVRWLLDSLTNGPGVIRRGKQRGRILPRPHAGIEGAPKVLRMKGGFSLDRIREALSQEPRWQGITDDITVFLDAVTDAVMHGYAENTGQPTPRKIGLETWGVLEGLYEVKPGIKWWADPVSLLDEDELSDRDVAGDANEGDTSFNIEEFGQGLFDDLEEPPAGVDVLTTGEQQPRLPGDVGDVREQEVATPAEEAPFSLTAETSKRKAKQTELFQGAWHGSPHVFEKFALHAIGSGEGAQVYGWGLYFASKREVAEGYRERLAGKGLTVPEITLDGEAWVELGDLSEEELIGLKDLDNRVRLSHLKDPAAAFAQMRVDIIQDISDIEEHRDVNERLDWEDSGRLRGAKLALAVLDKYGDQLGMQSPPKPGRLYKVEIPENEDYLDWDKPASQQSPKVQAALKALGLTWQKLEYPSLDEAKRLINQRLAEEGLEMDVREELVEGLRLAQNNHAAWFQEWFDRNHRHINPAGGDPKGAQLYADIATKIRRSSVVRQFAPGEDQRAASEALAAQGIAGIRYLDGFSRAAGQGSHNFVVFDDRLVEIREFFQPGQELTDQDVRAWASNVKEAMGPDLAAFDVVMTYGAGNPEGDILLDGLAVNRGAQRAGLGSRVMQQLTQFADQHGKRIVLTTGDTGGLYGTTSAARLVTFYQRFGFVENKGRHHDPAVAASMYREPTARLTDLAQPAPAPTFYSQMANVLERKMPARASVAQILGLLRNPQNGVKPDELKWSGLEEWLAAQEGPITKADVTTFLEANAITVEEVTRGIPEDIRNAANTFDEIRTELVGYLVGAYEFTDIGAAEYARDAAQMRLSPSQLQAAREDPELTRLTMDILRAQNEIDTIQKSGGKSFKAPKFASYQMPGGTEYRELLLTLPNPPKRWNDGSPITAEDLSTPEGRETAARVGTTDRVDYRSGHWDEPNVLAHIRFNTRTDQSTGGKVLFIEEIQSDWHQEGRRKGYAPSGAELERLEAALKEAEAAHTVNADARHDAIQRWKWGHGVPELEALEREIQQKERTRPDISPADVETFNAELTDLYERREEIRTQLRAEVDAADAAADATWEAVQAAREPLRGGARVPEAPFKTSWTELALKRMIRYAAENGYERVAWTPGDVQADRYDLSHHVSKLEWIPDKRILSAWNLNGDQTLDKVLDSDAQLEDYIGKEAAERLLAAPLAGARLLDVEIDPAYDETWNVIDQDGEIVDRDYRSAEEAGAAADRMMAARGSGGAQVLEGLELKIGGKGMIGFYDDILPKTANKYLKRWGVKVEDAYLKDPNTAIANDSSAHAAAIGAVPVHSFAVTAEMRESVLKTGQALFAPNRRGSIRFGADRQMTISLFERADLSTFLHETGHFFLEVLSDVASRPDVAAPLRQDLETIRAWVGNTGGTWTTEQHEQFARGFEAYLLEGKAPSLELREAFARFRAWLVGIYRTLTGLNVQLTPEVRRVFDRMIATDQAIAEAQAAGRVDPMFTTPEAAGMSARDFELYRAKIADASRTAREELERKVLAEVQREQEQAWKDARAEVEAAVVAEVHARPVYQALAAMQRGTNPDGTALEGVDEPLKLSRAILVERYGKDRLKRLPRPYVYAAEGGLDPDGVAAAFGFSSGDELLTAIEEAEPMRDVIQRETERRMLARHGSILLDGTLLENAQAALSNEDREIVIRAELRALGQLRRTVAPFVKAARSEERAERAYERRWFDAEAKLKLAQQKGESAAVIAELEAEVKNLRQKARGGAATIRAAIPPANTLRDAARGRVARTRIRDLKPAAFWSASRRAAQKAIDAAARQDFDGAIVAKQQELMNLALYRETMRAIDDAKDRVRQAKDLGKPAARARLGLAGEAYLDQVDGILDRYEFATVSKRVLDRRASLRRFVAGLEGEGLPVDIPEELLEETRRVNHLELTYEELVGVSDGLRQLLHLANLKNRLLKNRDKRELDDLAGRLGASIREHARGRAPATSRDRRPEEERRRAIADFFAGHRKLASMLRELDGFLDGGPAWEAIMVPLNEAGAREAEMNADATRQLAAIVERAFPGKEKRTLYTKTHLPAIGRSLSRMERIMVAANWGNDGNRDRIRRAEGWTDGQVQAILDTLTRADLDFVQGIFDLVNSYWPDIAAKQQRVYGVAPEKVEARAITTAAGEIPGGYFPLKYDDRLSAKAIQNLDLEAANLARNAAYTQASTKRGHTKERVSRVKIPVRLDFGVIFEHLGQVIHDLSHHETLIDVGRVLGHADVQAAILETQGDLVYKQIRNTVRDVAFGDIPAVNGFERAVNHVRAGATVAGLAWNVTTAILQPIGLTNSMARIGPTWVARGVARWLRNPFTMIETVKWIEERSAFMRARGRTQQREINEIRNQVGVNTGKLGGWVDEVLSSTTRDTVTRQGIADSYFWMIQTMQRVADVPTWLGMYEKAMAAGETEDRAVSMADQAVLDSQGGGQIKDLAQVQRGGPMMRLWTNFYSYFNVVYNQATESKRRTRFKHPAEVGRLASDYLLLFVIPATLGFMIREAMRGPREDEDEEELAKRLALENVSYIAGTMLGLREVSGVLQGAYGYEGPAGARAFASLARLGKQVQQGEPDEALIRSINDVAGVLFHYPAGQVWKSLTGTAAVAEGKADNPVTAVIAGPPRE